jgi:dihydrofolate reductase
MNLIVAVDNNRGIGYDGKLLFSIPDDMAYFKKTTAGKVVVMGLATLRSLPKSKPLSNRTNIILSHEGTPIEGAIVCGSVEQVLSEARKHAPADVFVIGGESVYAALLDYCTRAYITKINAAVKADRYFPNIDERENWALESESETRIYEGTEYKFTEYVNKTPVV